MTTSTGVRERRRTIYPRTWGGFEDRPREGEWVLEFVNCTTDQRFVTERMVKALPRECGHCIAAASDSMKNNEGSKILLFPYHGRSSITMVHSSSTPGERDSQGDRERDQGQPRQRGLAIKVSLSNQPSRRTVW